MLFAIAFSIVASKLLDKFPRKFTVVIPLVIMLTSLLYPPIRYRLEPEEALTFTRTTLQVESMQKINLYSDFSEARFIHPRVNLITEVDLLNTDLSNKSFREKREIVQNPKKRFPILRLNEYWTAPDQNRWKAENIDERANRLLNTILAHWKFNN
jgi:hypothetical protein